MSGTTTEPSPPPSPPTTEERFGPPMPGPRRRRTSRRVLVVFVLLAAALTFLLVEGVGSSLDYFDTVDQAYAHRASLGTSTFRLEGTVVPGTIKATALGTDFDICQRPHLVHVTNTGSPPGLFRARIPVVVVGHFTSATSDTFLSNSILVKHSATYDAENPGRKVKVATGPIC